MLKTIVSKRVKIINIVLFVLFFVFAALQLNDPDPFLWVFVYLFTGILFLISNYKMIPKVVLWVIFTALIIFAFFYIPSFLDWLQIDNKEEIFGEMVYEKPYLEGTREFLGLLIAAFAVFYLIRQN